MINFKSLSIPDVVLIEPHVYIDERGFFFESFNQIEFEKAIGGKVNFVQDNHSMSCAGVLRGLHFQKPPFSQGKLVRVVKGEIFDVAVDIRKKSKTFGRWVGVNLSESNFKQLWIPPGFAHGFYTLSEKAELVYKTTNFYSAEHDRSILWNDKDINILWPINIDPIISSKDSKASSFKDSDHF